MISNTGRKYFKTDVKTENMVTRKIYRRVKNANFITYYHTEFS